jgi:hypothetical protein
MMRSARYQACDLNFKERYGEFGNGFFEVHLLRPIATLEEGVAVTYDIAADFAVLCANCHRMIHRSADPSNLSLFQTNLASPKTEIGKSLRGQGNQIRRMTGYGTSKHLPRRRPHMPLSGLKQSVQRRVYEFTHYAEVDPREGISRR